ncbi:hypothetical protein LMJ53_16800 [Rheinheimera sp. UJ51]|uniref:hypothetical protein n=1 Tax=Rheinheimera sp. UJ51 TaxID=2892446 RepID=UPI001E3025D9|nr:hypothetical protein [Rheinheimera sp. UJ51]MCC5453376.1 hypothetical protein [Rheinheimera sp. UJ51]
MPTGTKRDTNQIKELQAKINAMQKQLGWGRPQLAEAIYCELHEDDDTERMQKFAESLKKQLIRETTPIELLQRYIKIISAHDEFRKADRVLANPIRLDVVDISILRGVSAAAKLLLQDIECE